MIVSVDCCSVVGAYLLTPFPVLLWLLDLTFSLTPKSRVLMWWEIRLVTAHSVWLISYLVVSGPRLFFQPPQLFRRFQIVVLPIAACVRHVRTSALPGSACLLTRDPCVGKLCVVVLGIQQISRCCGRVVISGAQLFPQES